jgi:hypothetical protein
MGQLGLAEVLGSVRGPLFLARRTGSDTRPLVSLHTTDRKARETILRQARVALAAAGIETVCRVVVHRPSVLSRVRSLETLLNHLGTGAIVYDPTQFVGRTKAVCDIAARLRAAMPDVIEDLFVDAARRTLVVVVDRHKYPKGVEERLEARARTLDQVAAIFLQWQTDEQPGFDLAIRVGFEPPAGAKLIAVDRATARSVFRSLLRLRALQAAAASLFGITATVPAMAQDAGPLGPYDPSLTIVTQGALFDSAHFGNDAWGSVGLKGTVPIGNFYGLMGEASIGTNGYLGAAGHFYWRDPTKGLFGGFASYETDDNGNRSRFGVEGHVYYNVLSLKGVAGYQDSDSEGNGFVGKLDLTFYATPNFSVTGGVGTEPLGTYGHAGFEWQPAWAAAHDMSVFVDGRLGESGTNRLLAGLKLNFGGTGSTLMERQRYNSPDEALGSPIAVAKNNYPTPK